MDYVIVGGRVHVRACSTLYRGCAPECPAAFMDAYGESQADLKERLERLAAAEPREGGNRSAVVQLPGWTWTGDRYAHPGGAAFRRSLAGDRWWLTGADRKTLGFADSPAEAAAAALGFEIVRLTGGNWGWQRVDGEYTTMSLGQWFATAELAALDALRHHESRATARATIDRPRDGAYAPVRVDPQGAAERDGELATAGSRRCADRDSPGTIGGAVVSAESRATAQRQTPAGNYSPAADREVVIDDAHAVAERRADSTGGPASPDQEPASRSLSPAAGDDAAGGGGVGTDPLHPTGRCTCAGEGTCEWCARICKRCGGCGYEPEPPAEREAAIDELRRQFRENDEIAEELARAPIPAEQPAPLADVLVPTKASAKTPAQPAPAELPPPAEGARPDIRSWVDKQFDDPELRAEYRKTCEANLSESDVAQRLLAEREIARLDLLEANAAAQRDRAELVAELERVRGKYERAMIGHAEVVKRGDEQLALIRQQRDEAVRALNALRGQYDELRAVALDIAGSVNRLTEAVEARALRAKGTGAG